MRLYTHTHTHTHGYIKRKNNIIKTVIFILIFCLLLYCITKILWTSPTAISDFYKEPKNSLDIIYIGASNVYAHFNTVLAYNLYGFTTGLLSADSQVIVMTKNLMIEAEKYQKPSLYIVDLSRAIETIDSLNDGEIRKTLDSMKFTKNRIDAINETLKYKSNIDKKDYINYYFSFLMYHNKWTHPTIKNLTNNSGLFKGYLLTGFTTVITPIEEYKWIPDKSDLAEENIQILNDLIYYIKSNNVNVLFVVPKRYFDEETIGKLNNVIEMLSNENLAVINFNTLEDFNNIDFSTDFYNKSHLNIYGSTKYTLYFARYLKEHYELPNHKKDPNYSSWDVEYQNFKKAFNMYTNQDFDNLLLEYN